MLIRIALNKAIWALEVFSCIMLLTMMLLTFADVVGRYIFSAPIFGAAEMVQSLLAFIVFAGLAIANARDDHIVVELFDYRIRRLAPRAYRIAIQSFSVAGMLLVVSVLYANTSEAWSEDSRTVVLEIPLFLVIGTISLLASVSLCTQIAGIFAESSNT